MNFTIAPGQTVAFVGENGSGKTTITQLLLRFYHPNRGQINLDGHDINHLDVKQLRRHIGKW